MAGQYTLNREPRPGSLANVDRPAVLFDVPKVARPRPVPRPSCFVVKNGSKIWLWISVDIPTPLSLTR